MGVPVECPFCQVGVMKLEPNYKEDDVYDVYVCGICEHEEVSYLL